MTDALKKVLVKLMVAPRSETEKMFRQLCDDHRSKTGKNYDCVIPVSGGKDSFYQVHLMKKYGIRVRDTEYDGGETDAS